MTITIRKKGAGRYSKSAHFWANENEKEMKLKVGKFAKDVQFTSPDNLVADIPKEKTVSQDVNIPSEIYEQILNHNCVVIEGLQFVGLSNTLEMQHLVPYTEEEMKQQNQTVETFFKMYVELYKVHWEKDKILKEYGV